MASIRRTVSVCADVAVIAAAVIFGWKTLWKTEGGAAQPTGGSRGSGPAPGMSLGSIYGKWHEGERNVVLFLSRNCRYCTESASFYRRLVSEIIQERKFRVIVFFPHDVDSGREYLALLGLSVADVQGDVSLPWRPVRTPVLMLCDSKGVIMRVWIGLLSPFQEREVLSEVKRAMPPACRLLADPTGGV